MAVTMKAIRRTTVVGALVLVIASCASPRNETASRDGNVPLGPTSANAEIDFRIELRSRHQAALDAFTSGVNIPGSPDYRHYLTADEFGRRFGPSDRDIGAVRAWLQSGGVDVVAENPQRTALTVRGNAANVERLLGVKLRDYRAEESNERFHRPFGTAAVPAALQHSISSIDGLDTMPVWHTFAAGRPDATIDASCLKTGACLGPRQLARAFSFQSLHDKKITGKNQDVGVIMWATPNHDDLNLWGNAVGIDMSKHETDHFVGDHPSDTDQADGEDEATLDVESILSVAPDAQVTVYVMATNDHAGFDAAVDAIPGTTHIVDYSAGGCDLSEQNADGSVTPATDLHAELHKDFADAAGRGVNNIFVADGDTAAFECSRHSPKDFRVTVSKPASSPDVIAVGGTTLRRAVDGTYVGEAGWEKPLENQGTGGGVNPYDARPTAWQTGPGVIPASPDDRLIPDVAAPADPFSTWFIVIGGKVTLEGGTSAAAPFWAGMAALFQQQLGRPLPFLNPILYALAATPHRNQMFHDVVQGSNLHYTAGPGWDYVTGLGTPIGEKLSNGIVNYLKSH
jgi:kumamolisin